MSADRYVITDQMWAAMEPRCLGKSTDPGRTASDPRLFLEAVLWLARTGCPCPGAIHFPAVHVHVHERVPPCFGKWSTVFKRFRDWVKAVVFKRIFNALSGETDMEYAMIDGTIVKIHRHGQGAKGGTRSRLLASPEAK